MRDMSGSVGSILKSTETDKQVHVIDDYYLCEIDAPTVFIDKTLGELNVRAEYQVDILLIKKLQASYPDINNTGIQPDANYKIELGDKLLLFGKKDSINIISKM